MKYKNYYKVLGLPNAKVTDDEIKSAYRHLAKLYHPDLNGGNPQNSEKFKDINEAYQILGDVNARKKYDRVYFAYKFRDGFDVSTVKSKVNVSSGASDFFTMFFGAKKEPTVVTNFDKYYQADSKETGDNLESEIDISLEEAFFGGERKIAFKTIDNKLKTLVVKIPRGVHTGEKIRLLGQGKPGKNGGQNGDFYIKVNILPHDNLRIEGIDLIKDLAITPWEAALGCEIEINGIDSNIILNIPAGVQTDEKFRVANAGYIDGASARGDLIVNIKIMIPKRISDKEKELFLKFKEISTYNPRKN